jgi:photosystem II stability/assembly factor-like uncharacterized protein
MKNLQKILIVTILILNTLIFYNSVYGQWQRSNGPYTEDFMFSVFREADTIYAISDRELYKSYDFGESWNYYSYLTNNQYFSKIREFEHQDSVFIVYGDSAIYISKDYGNSWSQQIIEECDSIFDYWVFDYVYIYPEIHNFKFYEYDIYATTDYGLYRLSSNDSMFIRLDSSGKNHLYNVYINDSLIVCDNYHGYQTSFDNGNTWHYSTINPYQSGGYFFEHQSNLYSCRSHGIYISNDQGLSWSKDSNLLPTSSSIRNFFMEDSIWYLSLYDTAMLKSDDFGATWSLISNGLPLRLTFNHITDLNKENDTIYVCYSYGGVFKSTDAGNNWEHKSNGMKYANTRLIECYGDTIIIATHPQGPGLFRSIDGGQSWKCINNHEISEICTMKRDRTNLYIVHHDGISVSSDFGDNWHRVLTQSSISAIDVEDSIIICGFDNNKLKISYDSGQTWSNRNLANQYGNYVRQIYIKKNEIIATAFQLYYSNDTGNNFTCITPGMFPYYNYFDYDGTHLFAPTQDGLMYSNNKGGNWTILSPLGSVFPMPFTDVTIIDDFVFLGSYDDTVIYSKIGDFYWKYYNEGLKAPPLFFGKNKTHLFATTYNGLFRRPLLQSVSSTEESIRKYGVKVYPNPTSDIIYIDPGKSINTSEKFSSIRIYNIQGKIVNEILQENNHDIIQIDCSDLKPGIYLLHIEGDKLSFSHKIIKA